MFFYVPEYDFDYEIQQHVVILLDRNWMEEQEYLDMYRIKHNFYLFQHLLSNVDQNFVEYPKKKSMYFVFDEKLVESQGNER